MQARVVRLRPPPQSASSDPPALFRRESNQAAARARPNLPSTSHSAPRSALTKTAVSNQPSHSSPITRAISNAQRKHLPATPPPPSPLPALLQTLGPTSRPYFPILGALSSPTTRSSMKNGVQAW
ncbi:hypothetical protein EJ06DRAFT_92975 [Trichodelitschia bisporula]|uniref:Uncharacterized protein n=1 Tax=Trichodelitschia bisporula TaxID=703511 RepID=A0A6G1HS53_9PEZI|nr:hypothetical protein EJ06DRAFT_92975 [Trichodelitschia bisporula]